MTRPFSPLLFALGLLSLAAESLRALPGAWHRLSLRRAWEQTRDERERDRDDGGGAARVAVHMRAGADTSCGLFIDGDVEGITDDPSAVTCSKCSTTTPPRSPTWPRPGRTIAESAADVRLSGWYRGLSAEEQAEADALLLDGESLPDSRREAWDGETVRMVGEMGVTVGGE